VIRENIENEILQHALEAFKKHIALPVAIEKKAEVAIHDLRADWLLKMRVQETELRFYAEIKTNITKAVRALIKIQKAQFQFPYPILLVTRYVTAQMAEQLKQDDIQFIDTAGNVYINQPPLYVYVKGNRPPDIFPRLKRAFKPTGLKVVYAFLCNPDLLNKTYREIAQAANVALGTVGWIIRDLKEMGYLLDMAKRGYRLIQKEDLLKRWLIDYPEKLRPKLLLGRFRGPQGWWQQKTLDPMYAQWGGEVAATKLTKYLKPQTITIYTKREQLNTLLVENRLKREINGDIEILEKFWTPLEKWQYEDTVNPILIYADLMATGDQRNIETAKVIYEQYLVRYLRED
jgi:hypothetical protein